MIDDVQNTDPVKADGVVWGLGWACGLRLARRVLPLLLPGPHPSVEWLQVGATLEEEEPPSAAGRSTSTCEPLLLLAVVMLRSMRAQLLSTEAVFKVLPRAH